MTEQVTFDFYEDSFGTRYVARMFGHEAELRISRRSPHVWSLDHASVPTAMGGRWVAEALIAYAVRDASVSQRKLLPLCSFVRALFQRHPEWDPVRADQFEPRTCDVRARPDSDKHVSAALLEGAFLAQARMNEKARAELE